MTLYSILFTHSLSIVNYSCTFLPSFVLSPNPLSLHVCPMKQWLNHLLAIALKAIVRGIGRSVYSLRIQNAAAIPAQGGALLVANHAGYMDFVILVSSVKRPVRFVMNADVFHKPILRSILRALQCVPIAARNGKNDLEAFNAAVLSLLNAGELVAIFAEGTVTRTGQLLEFRKGVEHLSKATTAPVVPIHFDNVYGTPFTFRAGQKIKLFGSHLRKRISVRFGDPIYGGISAFALRQRVKELEMENFAERMRVLPHLSHEITNLLRKKTAGSWHSQQSHTSFQHLLSLLSPWEATLHHALSHQNVVGVLLPNDHRSLLIQLLLLRKGITVVNIPNEFTNEQREFVRKHSGFTSLITTKDLNFTQYAPTADAVIYIEEIEKAALLFRPVPVACKRYHEVKNFFTAKPIAKEKPVAVVYHLLENNDIESHAVSSVQLWSVIKGLRQIHHFEKGISIYAELSVSDAFGYTLQFLLPIMCEANLHLGSEQFVDDILRIQPSIIFATPMQLRLLAESATTTNLPFVTTIFTAQVHPNDPAIATLVSRGIAVMACAGSNATASVYSVNVHDYLGLDIAGKPLQQEASKQGSVGKPLPGMCVRIVDASGNELGPMEIGNVQLRGIALGNTHWHATSLHGYLNQQGFLFLTH